MPPDPSLFPIDPLAALVAGLSDRYEIGAELGRGGMAVVYRAIDRRHDRAVAIKVVRPGVLATAEATDRFLREIRYAAQLSHPHILPLYESGEVPGAAPPLLYYVMPLLGGQTLRERLVRETRFPIDQALRLTRALAGALDYAHRRQIVHRDIKPENIMLHEGEPVIADFGVARGLCETCEPLVTEPGMAVGTPVYMSPEQASADPAVDGRSDQYSLACVLYEMLAGQPPFAGSSPRATMARHISDPVPSLRALRPDVPVAVEHALLRALAKEPADRFATLAEFGEALVTPLSGLPSFTEPRTLRCVAVLPFVNASADPENEYFSDGMTDEVINALANVPGLQVSSRTSSFALKGRRDDVRTLGALLGVSVVLEGSVRKVGHRLRLTAQLTDVEEGRLLWSERYDREDTDVFALQDELALAIVDRLRERLVGPVGEPVPHRATASLAAYTLYLKGRYAWNRRTAEGTREAIRLFTETITVDPGYALAYTGLADAHALQVDYRIAPVTEGMAAARQMAERAISLDDTLAEAHTSLAWVTFIHDWDWARAGAEFRRAIELNPRYPTARQWHAWYLGAMGRLAEAVAEAERAVELDPASISIQRGLGWLYAVARQPDRAVARLERAMVMNPEAVETLIVLGVAQEQAGRLADAEASVREALTIAPDDTSGLATLARILMRAGRPDEALALRDRFEELGRSRYISPSDAAKLALALGDHDGAFAALDRAFDERRGWLVYLKADPLFDPIRSDARFAALVRRMHLPG